MQLAVWIIVSALVTYVFIGAALWEHIKDKYVGSMSSLAADMQYLRHYEGKWWVAAFLLGPKIESLRKEVFIKFDEKVFSVLEQEHAFFLLDHMHHTMQTFYQEYLRSNAKLQGEIKEEFVSRLHAFSKTRAYDKAKALILGGCIGTENLTDKINRPNFVLEVLNCLMKGAVQKA